MLPEVLRKKNVGNNKVPQKVVLIEIDIHMSVHRNIIPNYS